MSFDPEGGGAAKSMWAAPAAPAAGIAPFGGVQHSPFMSFPSTTAAPGAPADAAQYGGRIGEGTIPSSEASPKVHPPAHARHRSSHAYQPVASYADDSQNDLPLLQGAPLHRCALSSAQGGLVVASKPRG